MQHSTTRNLTSVAAMGALLGLPAAAIANEDCADPGFHLELAALYLQVGATEGYADDTDAEYAWRGSLSYETAGGLFFRTTYFNSDGNWDEDDYLDITSWDFLVGDTICCGPNTAVEIAGGLRYTSFDQESEIDLSGWGPVISIEAQRTLTDCWSLYAGVTQSFVIGDNDEGDYDNEIFGMTEIGAGVQIDLGGLGGSLGGFSDMYVRIGGEGQYYYGSSEDDTQDAALFGGGVTVGFSF